MSTRPWTLERLAHLLEELERALIGQQIRPVTDIRADLKDASTWLNMVVTRFDMVLRSRKFDHPRGDG